MIRSIPLLILFGAAAELASIIWVGGVLGVLPTLLLLLGGGVAGVALIRSAGAGILTALRAPAQPARRQEGLASQAIARVAAGLLFMIPGFLSDVLALLLLLPPVRRWLQKRMPVEFGSSPPGQRAPAQGPIIEGEAVEIMAEVEGSRSLNRTERQQ